MRDCPEIFAQQLFCLPFWARNVQYKKHKSQMQSLNYGSLDKQKSNPTTFHENPIGFITSEPLAQTLQKIKSPIQKG